MMNIVIAAIPERKSDICRASIERYLIKYPLVLHRKAVNDI
jgi:hypothetical protein